MELIQFLIILCTLKIVLRHTHCPEPSPPQDDRLASFPYSPSILINESCPFTAWAEFADGPPLPQNASISISIELVDNKYDVIQAGLSTSSGPVSVVEATFEGRSARTVKFGINKTSCDVYGGCRIDEFHNHNHAMLHFRFTIRIDNMAYQYYTPGFRVLSKMSSGDQLQYFIDAQRDLPRSTCHFGNDSARESPQGSNRSQRYTIRVFYPAFDIQDWSPADLDQHIARCMGRVIPEAQGHHEIGGGQQIFAVYDVQEPQEAENRDVIDQMPLDIDPEVVNPAEPANAIHNADWQLQQDFGNAEEDGIGPFMVYMDNLEQPWQTPFYHRGHAPPNILPETPEHPPYSQQEREDALIHSPDIYNPRQEIQEVENRDVVVQMPLDIDSEVVNPAEPANAIPNAEWLLQEQGVDDAEEDGVDALELRGNIHDWPWQTPIDHHGDAPSDLLPETPEHPPRAQDANLTAEFLMMTIDENATEDNEEDDVDGKGDDYLYWD